MLWVEIKWFDSRINQYQRSQMFVNNQGRFFQRLTEEENHWCEIPNSVEAHTFRRGLWSEKKEHYMDAEWLEDVKELEHGEDQDKIDITIKTKWWE